MNKKVFGIILSSAVIIAIALYFYISKRAGFNNRNKPVFCTQEAKQCPDGSYVGRIGPKCEFAPCP